MQTRTVNNVVSIAESECSKWWRADWSTFVHFSKPFMRNRKWDSELLFKPNQMRGMYQLMLVLWRNKCIWCERCWGIEFVHSNVIIQFANSANWIIARVYNNSCSQIRRHSTQWLETHTHILHKLKLSFKASGDTCWLLHEYSCRYPRLSIFQEFHFQYSTHAWHTHTRYAFH